MITQPYYRWPTGSHDSGMGPYEVWRIRPTFTTPQGDFICRYSTAEEADAVINLLNNIRPDVASARKITSDPRTLQRVWVLEVSMMACVGEHPYDDGGEHDRRIREWRSTPLGIELDQLRLSARD